MKIYRSEFIRKSFYTLYFPLLLFLVSLSMSSCKPQVESLPYLGVHETKENTVDGKTVVDTQYYQVPAFTLTDQDSLQLTEESVKDKVYVAYFFFTSCPATCPIMTNAMKRVYKVVGDNENFEIIAHTIDPKRDTPQKLKQFSIINEVEHDNWHFLTGEMDYIYDLGMKGYYLSMGKHDAAPGGYIHSAKFILLDQNRHIRGIYEGTDANEVADLISGIQFLLQEVKIQS